MQIPSTHAAAAAVVVAAVISPDLGQKKQSVPHRVSRVLAWVGIGRVLGPPHAMLLAVPLQGSLAERKKRSTQQKRLTPISSKQRLQLPHASKPVHR